MWTSIQENLKKINSYISWGDCLSLLTTTVFLATLISFLYIKKSDSYIPVKYIESGGNTSHIDGEPRPFASIGGKTYTFSWCQGSSVISEKNKIYFKSEEDAKNSGRELSKLCQK